MAAVGVCHEEDWKAGAVSGKFMSPRRASAGGVLVALWLSATRKSIKTAPPPLKGSHSNPHSHRNCLLPMAPPTAGIGREFTVAPADTLVTGWERHVTL